MKTFKHIFVGDNIEDAIKRFDEFVIPDGFFISYKYVKKYEKVFEVETIGKTVDDALKDAMPKLGKVERDDIVVVDKVVLIEPISKSYEVEAINTTEAFVLVLEKCKAEFGLEDRKGIRFGESVLLKKGRRHFFGCLFR
jgi:hypothetical protein